MLNVAKTNGLSCQNIKLPSVDKASERRAQGDGRGKGTSYFAAKIAKHP